MFRAQLIKYNSNHTKLLNLSEATNYADLFASRGARSGNELASRNNAQAHARQATEWVSE